MIYVRASTNNPGFRSNLHKFNSMQDALKYVSEYSHIWSEFKIFTHDSDMGRLFDLLEKLGRLWGRMFVKDSTHGNFISKSDAAFELHKLRDELELVLVLM